MLPMIMKSKSPPLYAMIYRAFHARRRRSLLGWHHRQHSSRKNSTSAMPCSIPCPVRRLTNSRHVLSRNHTIVRVVGHDLTREGQMKMFAEYDAQLKHKWYVRAAARGRTHDPSPLFCTVSLSSATESWTCLASLRTRHRPDRSLMTAWLCFDEMIAPKVSASQLVPLRWWDCVGQCRI